MAKFLLVDDDYEYALNLKQWFKEKSIDVEIAGTAGDALQLLQSYSFDLILLDWMLPDMTGLDICQRYRKDGGKTQIIFLTGEGDIERKEAALLSGSDDYLVKPFDVRELYARAQSVLRRSLTLAPNELTIQEVTLLPEEKIAVCGEKKIRMTPKESAILEYLMRHPNRPFSASRLLTAIWSSDTEISEGTVRTMVLNLRKKLAEIGKGDLIKLVVNSGYVIEKD